jgi:hypothetical protein
MNRRKELPLSRNDPGTKPHPHRASAWPDCCFADALGPAMQRGGGSKLKGLMGRAPYPHADAAFRPIGSTGRAIGSAPERPWSWGESFHRTY